MNKEEYNIQIHKLGRLFTWIAVSAIAVLPIIFCLITGAVPHWRAILGASAFIVGYWAIGLIEAISYAPLLGSGGQYQSFITGNIANLKLPCAINTQTILKTKQGTEEEEVITSISIAVSTITTTIIIVLGLIPLSIFSQPIIKVLAPVSPYVIPAIFGGLTVVLLSRYLKLTIAPFIVCIAITCIAFTVGFDIGQSTMVPIGMVISIISAIIMHKLKKNKTNK